MRFPAITALVLLAMVAPWPDVASHTRPRYAQVRGDGLPPRIPDATFFNQRAFPHGTIRRADVVRARAEAKALRATAVAARSWAPEGPTNIGGRVTDLAVHPGDDNIVYAAAAEGGVLRTTDAGQNWTPLFDAQEVLAVGAVAIDPSNPNVIFAGTGEVNPGGGSVAYGGDGLYRSRDAGVSWTNIGLANTGAIGRIRVDPEDPNRIFVAAMGHLWEEGPDRGVYRTLDGGKTWARVLHTGERVGCVDIIMRPDDPDILYAAMWERIRQPSFYDYGGPGCAVYRSIDGGDTWSLVGGGLPAPSVNGGRIGLSLCAAQPDVMHVVYADRTGFFDGLYRSTNGGFNWSRTNDSSLASVFSSFGWWFGNVRTHPVDPGVIFVLGLQFYRSEDGGSSYADVSDVMHVDHHALAFGSGVDPVMYAGNDGGVYRSTNGGSVWAKLPDLPITQVYRLALDANASARRYLGAQDNGTCRTLTASTDNWSMVFGGDGFQTLISPLSSARFWVQFQYGSLWFTETDGATYMPATGNISGADRKNWNSPITQQLTSPYTRYFGTQYVYRNLSDTSWTRISGDLTGGPGAGNNGQVNGTLTTIGVSSIDGNTIWTGSDDGFVHVTTNGGITWSNVSAGLPERWITSVRPDPFDANTAYVTISGFRWAEPLSHVYRTNDLGATWTPIDGNLPEVPVNDLIAQPSDRDWLIVATDLGVYESGDGGMTWREVGTGLPNVVTTSLAYQQSTQRLFAGTYGRSVFSVEITAPPCAGDLDDDGAVGFNDLVELLAAWDTSGGAADLDGDGIVGFNDLVMLLTLWGAC